MDCSSELETDAIGVEAGGGVGGGQCPSVASLPLSWNTPLSRTSVSSLSCARFSKQQSASVHGLSDVIRAVRTLKLSQYRYEDFVREEVLGTGETYVVERCASRDERVFAVKHVKVNDQSHRALFQRRLKSVILELQIMRHPPLRAHPNITLALGYGWNSGGNVVMPYIVVEHASLGTLRQHVRKPRNPSHLEILLGDVASGLTALHTCGIVHGDVKLDNVLVFPSFDRPGGALAKLTDFGHAIVLNDNSRDHNQFPLVYEGTSIYNAPEVDGQADHPISNDYLARCDIWAFGLLAWEACLRGEDYPTHLSNKAENHWKAHGLSETNDHRRPIETMDLLTLAKRSVPAPALGPSLFIRVAIHRCLQRDPTLRAPNAGTLPLYTKWNSSQVAGLQAALALHSETNIPTFEIFRFDNDKDISWGHQQQIFEGFVHALDENLAKNRNVLMWQIAICHYLGFGTIQNFAKASELATMAEAAHHPVATCFAHVMASDLLTANETYAAKISGLLLRSEVSKSSVMPAIVKAFCEGNKATAQQLLHDGARLSSSTIDGCGALHWLFMFQDHEQLEDITTTLLGLENSRLDASINLSFSTPRVIHPQWPLQLLGTPLAVAISVSSLSTVKALIRLGADPHVPVYCDTGFQPQDQRLQWTAFHAAARYHCADILEYLLENSDPERHPSLSPLGCALSFSTPLERRAIHGCQHAACLGRTISLIRSVQPVEAADSQGMTALMQAIDFQDYDIVHALLESTPDLATTRFTSPHSDDFTLPIHFACQIASQRDCVDTLKIPKLINSYGRNLSKTAAPARDHNGRTALHLAATGTSEVVARWILEENRGLLDVEDDAGRTPLHYVTSTAVCELLLGQGSNVDHTDKTGLATLHQLCLNGSSNLIPRLLKASPKLDLKRNKYGSPLHCAVIGGSVEAVLLLIQAGVPLGSTDEMGNTAVHAAAKLNRHQILRHLIRNEAQCESQNNNGHRPWDVALGEAQLGRAMTLRILRPQWATKADREILDSTPQEAKVLQAPILESQTNFVQKYDFSWEEAEDFAKGFEPSGPGYESSVLTAADGKEVLEIGSVEETEEMAMRAIQKTIGQVERVTGWPTLETHETSFLDLLVISTMAFVGNHIWNSEWANRAIEVMAWTAHDLAVELEFMYAPQYRLLSNPDAQGDRGHKARKRRLGTLNLHLEEDLGESGGEVGDKTWEADAWSTLDPSGTDERREETQLNAASSTSHSASSDTKDDSTENSSFLTSEEPRCPCGRPSVQHWLAVDLMITHIILVVLDFQPSGILPGRGLDDFKDNVTDELRGLGEVGMVEGRGPATKPKMSTFFRELQDPWQPLSTNPGACYLRWAKANRHYRNFAAGPRVNTYKESKESKDKWRDSMSNSPYIPHEADKNEQRLARRVVFKNIRN